MNVFCPSNLHNMKKKVGLSKQKTRTVTKVNKQVFFDYKMYDFHLFRFETVSWYFTLNFGVIFNPIRKGFLQCINEY